MSAQLSSESIIPRASDPDIDHDSASSNHRLSKILSERKMQASPDTVVSLDSRSSQSWNLDDLNLIAVLGRGIFGKVMLAEHKQTKEVFACKVLKKARVVENDEVATTRIERDVLKRCTADKHPFIAQFVASFQTETRLIFVMEYCPGGDLMFLLQRGPFGTPRSKFYASEFCLVLKYLHDNGILYRSVNLDNIMLGSDGHIKVVDFGLCKENMWFGSTTSTFCGTAEFMAPEILLDKPYGRATDWWSFGIIIYQMLLQQALFRGEDEDEIYDAILADEPDYPSSMPRDSVSILQGLLTKEPDQRLGSGPSDAQDVMGHKFFKDINWDNLYHKRVTPPFVPILNGPTDVSNFETEFTQAKPVLTPTEIVISPAIQEEFQGFSCVARDAEQP